MTKHYRLLAILIVVAGLSACTTIKMPSVNFPEFEDKTENVGPYPKAEEAPTAPTGLRSDAAWDSAAKNMVAKRESFNEAADLPAAETPQLINSEIGQLTRRADEYRADDPPPGRFNIDPK